MEPIAPTPVPVPRSLGQILDAAFDVVRRGWVLLVGLWALVYVPLSFLDDLEPASDAGLPPEQAFWLALLGPLLVGAFLVVSAGVTDACGELLHGRATDAGRALRRGLGLALPLLLAFLAMGLVAGLSVLPLAGLVAFGAGLGAVQIPAGIAAALLPLVLMLRLSLLTQVVIFERRTGFSALARANRLIDGFVLRVFGTYLVAGLLVALLGVAAGMALGALPAVGPAAVGIVQALGSAYSTAVGVVLYEEVRLRRGEAPAAPPPPPLAP